jgi:hypothetical protein
VVLGLRIGPGPAGGHVSLYEDPEFHGRSPSLASSRLPSI